MKDIMWWKGLLAFSDPSWTSAGLHRIFRISVGDDWCDWTSRYCSYINTVQAKKIVFLFPEMDHVKKFLNHLLPAPLRLHSWMYINIYLLFKKKTHIHATTKQKKLKMKREKQKKPHKIRRKNWYCEQHLWKIQRDTLILFVRLLCTSSYVIESWIFSYCSYLHEFNLHATREITEYIIL